MHSGPWLSPGHRNREALPLGDEEPDRRQGSNGLRVGSVSVTFLVTVTKYLTAAI